MPKDRLNKKLFFEKIKDRTKGEFDDQKLELTISEFIRYLAEKPQIAIRTTYQYLYDTIMYFGAEDERDCGEELVRYKLFDDPFDDGVHKVLGCLRPLNMLVNEIRSSAMEEGQERIVMLHGPVGTAKTTIINLIEEGLKHYSKTEEGTIFRFSWHFDLKKFHDLKVSGKIAGLGRELGEVDECDDCSGGCSGCSDQSGCGSAGQKTKVMVPCQINENPLHLIIDRKERKKFLEAIVEEYEQETGGTIIVPQKIVEGNLCYNCKQIYEGLLKKYDGDLEKVMEHVKIERFTLDADRGISVVEERTPTDMTQKVRVYATDLASLFPTIDFIAMFGKWAQANRGLIHYSDTIKPNVGEAPPPDAVEKKQVTMGGVKVGIDTGIFATSNLSEYEDTVNARYNEKLVDRVMRMDVNYLFNVDHDIEIYKGALERSVSKRKHIAPHTIELAALFSVLTRLSKPIVREPSRLTEMQKEFVSEITPMQKVEIYRGVENYQFEHIPDEKKNLVDDQLRKEMRNASNLFVENGVEMLKEGFYGVSPRRIQDLFKIILKDGDCLNPLNVIRFIDRVLREESSFFRNHLQLEDGMNAKATELKADLGDYHDSRKALSMVVEHCEKVIAREVKFSLLDMGEKDLDRTIEGYVDGLEKRRDKRLQQVDEYLMESVEKMCGATTEGSREELRDKIFIALSEYRTKNPDAKGDIDYRKALARVYGTIENKLFDEKLEEISLGRIEKGLEQMDTPAYQSFEEDVRADIERILSKMRKQYGYCKTCSREMTLYALKEGWLEKKAEQLEVEWEGEDFDEGVYGK